MRRGEARGGCGSLAHRGHVIRAASRGCGEAPARSTFFITQAGFSRLAAPSGRTHRETTTPPSPVCLRGRLHQRFSTGGSQPKMGSQYCPDWVVDNFPPFFLLISRIYLFSIMYLFSAVSLFGVISPPTALACPLHCLRQYLVDGDSFTPLVWIVCFVFFLHPEMKKVWFQKDTRARCEPLLSSPQGSND